jgi:succinate dehydrogenase/fumarate reductase flavoprotein subunit
VSNPEIKKFLTNVQAIMDEYVKIHRPANQLKKVWTPSQEAQMELLARAIADLKNAVAFLNESSDTALNSLDQRVRHLEGRKP